MKTVIAIIVALSNLGAINAFAVQPQAPAVTVNAPLTQVANIPSIEQIQQPTSFNQYLEKTSSLESSTTVLSLQERKIPTAEEIAAKKRNFNLWFWGGGFVAPFLATFYYFGLKFWER